MRELNVNEIKEVSGGIIPILPLVVPFVAAGASRLAFKAGKALGEWLAS